MKPLKNQDEKPANFKPLEKLSYEEALAELEKIVEILESNEKSLGDAMMYYQRGQELARFCANLLEQAELKVQIITGGEVVDFDES